MADAPPLTVSVVTPALGQGALLGRTLRSVAAQDYPVLEHHVIDGASTDQTLAVLRGAAQPGLSWVAERDRGRAHAVNKGIARARGDIIAWINAGDVYRPGALAAAAAYLQAHPQVDVVYGRAERFAVDGDIDGGIDGGIDGAVLGPYPTEDFDLARLHEACFLCQPATFFRRSCIERFGLLDERLRYCMDYEYWLRLARSGARFAYLPEVLAATRVDPARASAAARADRQREVVGMFRRGQGRVPTVWLLAYSRAVVGRHLDRQRHPRLFDAAATAGAVLAALRWNHGLPWDLAAAACRASDGASSPP